MGRRTKRRFLLLVTAALLITLSACGSRGGRDGREKDKEDDEEAEGGEIESSDSDSRGIWDEGQAFWEIDGTGTDDAQADYNTPLEILDGVTLRERDEPMSPKNLEGQFALIIDNSELWLDNEIVGSYFAVTDLNWNGRLEVISATEGGTGIFTYSRIYEVDEAMEGLYQMQSGYEEYDSQMDIIVDSTALYREGETFHYLFTDYLRNGWAENYLTVGALSVTDGAYQPTVLAYRIVTMTESEGDYVENTIYIDADGNEISEEEYNSAVDERFGLLQKYDVLFGWESMYELTETDLEQYVAASWEGFQIRKSEG